MNAGVAKVDITPPVGIPLAGSFHLRLGTHVEERLHARALVLEQNGQRQAIVTADVLGFRRDMVARVRRQCRRTCGTDVVLFNATHSHCGPNVCWEWSANEPARSTLPLIFISTRQ